MNKQIIVRTLISFIFIAVALRVLIPLAMDFIKKKISGQSGYNDIDLMIRKKQDLLRAQYNTPAASQIAKNAPAENHNKEIAKQIISNYSYTLSENKINGFLLVVEKRKLMNFVSSKYQQTAAQKINFLAQTLMLMLLSEELVKKSFTMSQVLAKKIGINLFEFTIGVQIKILTYMKNGARTEDQIFSDHYILHTFSDENITASIDSIIKKEADLWAQSPSLLFEELSLFFHFASIVQPLPLIKNKTDTKSAYIILGCLETESINDIKKKYKKMALEKHPDKIMAQKLPARLEKKGVENFNRIQEAYEIITQEKK